MTNRVHLDNNNVVNNVNGNWAKCQLNTVISNALNPNWAMRLGFYSSSFMLRFSFCFVFVFVRFGWRFPDVLQGILLNADLFVLFVLLSSLTAMSGMLSFCSSGWPLARPCWTGFQFLVAWLFNFLTVGLLVKLLPLQHLLFAPFLCALPYRPIVQLIPVD